MYEFEKHQRLTEFIQEMANTGKAPQEWTSFIETLNKALRIHDVVGRSEQLVAFLEFIEGYKMLEVDLEYEEIVRRFLGN